MNLRFDRIVALLPDHLTLYYVQALFYSLEAVNLTVSSVQLHFLRPDSILQLGSREPYGFTNGALNSCFIKYSVLFEDYIKMVMELELNTLPTNNI